ncbi:MAG: hypothetical protein NTU79_18110 [Planctomycetota bacterium]|nr:hypothetical protein [Planctomycetota bacterium]
MPVVSEIQSTPVNPSNQQGDLFLNQWLQIDKDRNVRGTVVVLLGSDTMSLRKVRVSLYQAGKVVAFDDTDTEGQFQIEGVSPGIYTLVAETGDSLAVFSLTILDSVAGEHLPSSVEVRMMSTVGGRTSEIIRGQTGRIPMWQQVPEKDPLVAKRKISSTHQVMIDANGTLKGELSKPVARVDMSSMVVYVMKDGIEVRKTNVASDGKFTVSGLGSGCYGLVAVGDQGVAATAFCATNRDLAMINADRSRFVGLTALPAVLNVELGDSIGDGTVPPENVVANENSALAPEMPCCGNASMGGGGGGGGGGTGAGGGFGKIAGIGGLIAVAAVLAADNGNKDAPLASKIVP